MAIEINGKVYRNLQEQVEENKNDIEALQDTSATKDYVDNSISALYGDFYTRGQADARFPTETHMNFLLGHKQDTLTAGTNITIDENNVISATGGGAEYMPGTGINIANNEISVDTNTIATVATLQSFTQSFGGEITAIYSGTSTVGKARQDALGRTIDEYYASKTDIPSTALNLYQHKYKFNYSDSTDGVYFKFEVAFISSRDTVYPTIADIFTYLLAHNNNGDIVGRTYGYEITLPTDWTFGGEIEADVTNSSLQFTVRDDSYQPLTYEVYNNSITLISSSCHLIN